jgi:hypothetical protein
MSEGSRVQRWRQQLREQGKKAITVWLTTEEEMRLKDLALQRHCSPSAIMQQALAQFAPHPTQDISNSHDTLLIQKLIRAELARIQGSLLPVTDTVMDMVTVTTPETPARETSTAPTPTTARVTDTDNGNVTDTQAVLEAHPEPVNASPGQSAPPRPKKRRKDAIAPAVLQAIATERQHHPAMPLRAFTRHLFETGIYRAQGRTGAAVPASLGVLHTWLGEAKEAGLL